MFRALLPCLICFAVAGCTLRGPQNAPVTAPAASVVEHSARVTPQERSANAMPAARQPTQQPVAASRLRVTATLPPQLVAHFAQVEALSAASETTEHAEHVVVWGDTLFGIATQYGTSVAALLQLNDLTDPDRIEVDQALKLPAAPETTTPGTILLPDALVVRSADAGDFNIAAFIASHPGPLKDMAGVVISRGAAGGIVETRLPASAIVERVSLEFSVDPRLLLALLDYRAGLLSESAADDERRVYPFISVDEAGGIDRAGLYAQLSWMADQLNSAYYGWKYRKRLTLDFADGRRLSYHPDLNAGTVALQYALSLYEAVDEWPHAVGETGFIALYHRHFGAPAADSSLHLAAPGEQPEMQLPFRAGEVWRFTGGFHGGWGNGSGWAALDFAPPFEPAKPYACFTSAYPLVAVADGVIARLAEGALILDLDMDGDEGSGWSILYLHITRVESLRTGQAVAAGETLGYASCLGGYSTATHLHIARRYNGEWLPADCPACAADRSPPPFVMSDWRAIGLRNQLYQGYMLHQRDNRSAIAEQGRDTIINEISW